MKNISIFGAPYEPKSEPVKLNGHSVLVHEFLDEDYFQHVTLPMREMGYPDNDEPAEVARYNRAFNVRLVALALQPSLKAEISDILTALSKETMKSMELLLAGAMRVNGLDQVKNSQTTTSDKD